MRKYADPGRSDVYPATSPCGICRQVLREFTHDEIPVYLATPDGAFEVSSTGTVRSGVDHVLRCQLLPRSFGPDNLPPPEKLEALNK